MIELYLGLVLVVAFQYAERNLHYTFCAVSLLHSLWRLNVVLDLREGHYHTLGIKLNCNRAATILWSDASVAP